MDDNLYMMNMIQLMVSRAVVVDYSGGSPGVLVPHVSPRYHGWDRWKRLVLVGEDIRFGGCENHAFRSVYATCLVDDEDQMLSS